MYHLILRSLLCVLLLSLSAEVIPQESFLESDSTEEPIVSKKSLMYRIFGLSFSSNKSITEDESERNKLFQSSVKHNAPISNIAFPFIGEFHFKDYSFLEQKTGIRQYNYFLGTAELHPSWFLFDSENNKASVRIGLGTRIRVWKKRRGTLRSNYSWEASHAVKTPSYLPGVFYSRLINHKQKGSTTILDYAEIGFTHHSNGQDAPTLLSQDSTLLLPDEYKYNLNDGDFSTNYISLAFNRTVIQNHRSYMHSFVLVFDGIGSERIEHEDLNIYRLDYRFQYLLNSTLSNGQANILPEHRIVIDLGFGFNSISSIEFDRSIRAELSYHYRIPFSKRIAAFINYGYKGQDDYNIFLNQKLHYFKFGFSSVIF